MIMISPPLQHAKIKRVRSSNLGHGGYPEMWLNFRFVEGCHELWSKSDGDDDINSVTSTSSNKISSYLSEEELSGMFKFITAEI